MFQQYCIVTCFVSELYVLQTTHPMPVLQLFAPANPHALAHDHDYIELCPEHQYLKENMVSLSSAVRASLHTS